MANGTTRADDERILRAMALRDRGLTWKAITAEVGGDPISLARAIKKIEAEAVE